MALYDGFFDAALADNGTYDREYNAEQFVEYFESFIGSGVCIYGNEDSFKVSYSDGNAIVAPGYLFINGYWLKNDANYSLSLSDAGNYAIIAQLSKAGRIINLGTSNNVSGAIGNALVLAYVAVATGGTVTVTDKRYDSDVCGVIDSIGGLNSRIEYILDYIDNSLNDKLDEMSISISARVGQLETQVNQQIAQLYTETESQTNLLNATTDELVSQLQAKLAEAELEMEKMEPLDVGSVRFSAAEMNDKWLVCDGSYVSAEQYPELVEALKDANPTSDKPVLVASNNAGLNISNGVLYGGRMWTYSYNDKKLYGISTSDGNIKAISVTSEDTAFNTFKSPTDTYPIALSIVPHKIGTGSAIFICQILANSDLDHSQYSYITRGSGLGRLKTKFLIFTAEFTGSETSLPVSYAFEEYPDINSLHYVRPNCLLFIPYVISQIDNNIERYYCMITQEFMYNYASGYTNKPYWFPVKWSTSKDAIFSPANADNTGGFGEVENYSSAYQTKYIQRLGYSRKAKYEALSMITYRGEAGGGNAGTIYSGGYENYSANQDLFYSVSSNEIKKGDTKYFRQTFGPMNLAGDPFCVVNFTGDKMTVTKSGENSYCKGIETGIELSTDAKVFVDGCAHAWGSGMYYFFVGTGLLFSKAMESNTFGYLDTTGVLGKIVNFGYIELNDDETELYILGQTSENKVVLGKIVLNNLKNYNTSGAFLPNMPASSNGGIPAYIKALEG